MKITGNIITLNEEHNIEACINSIKSVCDEIIVVDSNSSDKTVELAEALGAKVIAQAYLGDGPQKNVVLEHAQHDWILSLDADERLDDEMTTAILEVKTKQQHPDANSFKRKNYIADRWIKQCGWYPDVCVRLYNKNNARFRDVAGHSGVEAKSVTLLTGNIIHYSYKNYHDLLYKTNRFSSRGAKMLMDKNRKTNGFSPFLHFMAAFFRKYILQKGFLQGLDGLTISLTASINSYMKYAKLIEMRKSSKHTSSLWEQ